MRISDWSSDVCSSDLANPPWTRAKMNPALFSKMTGAIVGFEMRIAAWRPTITLSQNKSTDERGRVIAGVEETGHGALAELMGSEERRVGEEAVSKGGCWWGPDASKNKNRRKEK